MISVWPRLQCQDSSVSRRMKFRLINWQGSGYRLGAYVHTGTCDLFAFEEATDGCPELSCTHFLCSTLPSLALPWEISFRTIKSLAVQIFLINMKLWEFTLTVFFSYISSYIFSLSVAHTIFSHTKALIYLCI